MFFFVGGGLEPVFFFSCHLRYDIQTEWHGQKIGGLLDILQEMI